MTLPLLKTALEPLVRRQRNLRLHLRLAVAWLILAAAGFALHTLGLSGPVTLTGLLFAAAFTWAAVRRRVGAWEPDYAGIARDVERAHPDLHALLVTAVEPRPDAATGELNFLQQRVVADAVAEVRRRNCIQTLPASRIAGASALQFAALALLAFALHSMTQRTGPDAEVAAPAKGDRVSVTPGDVNVERGGGLVVLAKFDGEIPSEATLVYSAAGEPAKRIPLVKNLDDPVFGGGVPEVLADASYLVEYAGHATREFRVKVFEHPRLDRADATVRHPEFAKLPDKTIPDTRRVSAVQGSRLGVAFHLNKPVKSASLVAKDGAVVNLVVHPANPLAELRDYPVTESRSWELKLTDADGRANKLAANFSLEALANRRPQIKVITPKGDQRVSAIEEVAFRAEAWDDFGLVSAGITYTIGGGRTESVPLVKDSKADERLNIEHVLKLEDIGVKVDELVSWHLWAEDIGADGKARRTETDMFFAEVRPFEEVYRPGEESSGQGQGGQGQGGKGAEATKLADLQKQIISATWNLKRAEDAGAGAPGPGEKYMKDIVVVKDSQAEALGMATKFAEKIEDPKAQAFIGDAMREMERALQELGSAEKTAGPLPAALSAEQAAYNALLKLAAHEFRVSRSKGKGKGQQQGDRQRAQLDELEMKDEKQRYETQSEAQQPQEEEQREQLAVLNRLKELAQRQQDINERVKELQTALQEAKTDKEREEVRRQLKRLREEEQQLLADLDELKQKMEKEQNQSRFSEERKQLEKARAEAQQAAESLQRGESSKALAEGRRAEKTFQEMRDDLRKRASGQFKEEMRQMRADARELSERQSEIATQLEEKPKGNERRTLDGSSPREKLAQDFEKQQKSLEELRQQMQTVSEQAEAAEPLLARQLYDTLRENSQAATTDTLAQAGELARRGYSQQVKQFEEKVRGEMEKMKQGIERAAESVLGNEAEALRQARAELDALNRELEREIGRARPDLAVNSDRERPREGNSQASREAGGAEDSRDERGGSVRPGGNGEPKVQQPGGSGEGQDGGRKQAEREGAPTQPAEGREGDAVENSQPGKNGPGNNSKDGGSAKQKGDSQQGGKKGADAESGGAEAGKGGQDKGESEGKGAGQSQAQGKGEKGSGPGEGEGEGKSQSRGTQGRSGQGQGDGQGEGRAQNQSTDGKGAGQSSGAGQGSEGGPDGSERNTDASPSSRLANLAGGPPQRGVRTGNDRGGGLWGGGAEGEQAGPLTGENFVEWSDRLRNVEEMLDSPALRNEVARVREAARIARAEFKRHSVEPKWDMVKSQISAPLAELRDRVGEELARRDSKDALVPIDRDPVPSKYGDRVRRYYEELGRSR